MNQNLKIHGGYIIGILLAIIIILVSVKWSDVPNLANYLSFGLSVASLLLAVVAIVYAFFSNYAFSQTVAKLDGSSNIIREETAGLEKAVSGLQVQINEIPSALHILEDRLEKNNQTFGDAVSSLGAAATTIRQETAGLQGAVTGFQTQLKELPVALKSIEGEVIKTNVLMEQASKQTKAEPATVSSHASLQEYKSTAAKNLLQISSWNGLMVIYACCLAFQKNQTFKLRDWVTAVGGITADYGLGFLVGMAAAGILKVTDDGAGLLIKHVDKDVMEQIRDAIYDRSKKSAAYPAQISKSEQFIS